ncbi:hypothetical protein HanRHA438_Chr07g0302901 [Helianthus annuus]|nr:hypothetical protein HanRHA438_Chr07g0302901 [Helianthus annuus]
MKSAGMITLGPSELMSGTSGCVWKDDRTRYLASLECNMVTRIVTIYHKGQGGKDRVIEHGLYGMVVT